MPISTFIPTTGVDDNHDLVINDRPRDASGRTIGRNSAACGAARWGDISMRLRPRVRVRRPAVNRVARPAAARPPWRSKAAAVDRAPVAVVAARFSTGQQPLQISSSNAQADTSHRVNFTNYAGTMTSRLFGQPTSASQAGRVQLRVPVPAFSLSPGTILRMDLRLTGSWRSSAAARLASGTPSRKHSSARERASS